MGPDSANRVQNLCRSRLRIFVSTVNATFGLTKKLYTLTVHGDKAGNVLKSTCDGDRLENDIRKKKTLQSNSDMLLNLSIEIWGDVKNFFRT